MKKYLNIILKPQKVEFTRSGIRVTEALAGTFKIPYKEIIYAGIRVYDTETGIDYEPELAEITGSMDGDLVLYGTQGRRWKIQTDQTGKTAGSMLSELAQSAPYILAGGHTWIDLEKEEDFSEIEKMVNLMRECW